MHKVQAIESMHTNNWIVFVIRKIENEWLWSKIKKAILKIISLLFVLIERIFENRNKSFSWIKKMGKSFYGLLSVSMYNNALYGTCDALTWIWKNSSLRKYHISRISPWKYCQKSLKKLESSTFSPATKILIHTFTLFLALNSCFSIA